MYYVLFFLSILSTGYYFFAMYAARQFFSVSPVINFDFSPPITILKPVCGMENMAYDNFVSFCEQAYPVYQIIFGVKDLNDPIVSVINKIVKNFKHIDIELVVCERLLCSNPKINSLIAMQDKAKYPYLLVSDSDIRVGPTYLQEMIQCMNNQEVGIVTSLLKSVSTGFFSTVEAIGLATESLPRTLCAWKFNNIHALGGSMLIRQSALKKIGGISVVADHIAEDYLLGKLFMDVGYRIILSNYIVDNVSKKEMMIDVVRRKIRWDKGVFIYEPLGYLAIIFTYGSVFAFVFLLISHASSMGVAVFCLVLGSRLLMGWTIGANYLNDTAVKKYFWLSPLQDFYSFIIWIKCILINKMYWRESCFKIEKNGKLILYKKNDI